MTANDIRYGRRGGHNVPDGVRPGEGLADVDEVRRRAIADGTWPDVDEHQDDDEQGSLF